MRNLVSLLLTIGLIMVVSGMAYQLFSAYVTPPDFSGQEKPFEAGISSMSPPRPGVPVKMGLFGRALEYCRDFRMEADISRGFDVLSGETAWQGEVYAGDVRSVVFMVKPMGLGSFIVRGRVECRREDSLVQDIVEYEYDIDRERTTSTMRRP